MAALVITVTQVLPVAGSKRGRGVAAVAITAGQSLTKDASAGYTLKLSDFDTVANAAAEGLAMHGAAAGQPVEWCEEGDLVLGAGAAPVVGAAYFVGAAGGIVPAADVVNPKVVTYLGTGKTGNKLAVKIHRTEQTRA